MKIVIQLRILLSIQIVMYILGMALLYRGGHDGANDLSGIEAVVPFGICMLLGTVNVVLFLIYISRLPRKTVPDIAVLILGGIALLTILLYPWISNWASGATSWVPPEV